MPEPIREYINEVKQHLETLTHAEEGRQFTLEHKMNFLRETRHAFGRTALVLSGGGALGAFHVVRCCVLKGKMQHRHYIALPVHPKVKTSLF